MSRKELQRIVLFGKQKRRTRTTSQIVRALRRAGCAVKWINPMTRKSIVGADLARAWTLWSLRRFKPDALISWSQDLPVQIADAFPVPFAIFYVDIFAPPNERLESLARRSDVFFITNRGQLEQLRSMGVKNPRFLPEACDSLEHRCVSPAGGRYACDVAFVGRPYFPERIELIRHLARQFGVTAFGPGWDSQQFPGLKMAGEIVGERQMAALCASAKVIVGIDVASHVAPHLELCFSNRTWLTLGCGGFLVTRHVPCLEELFQDGKHLVWFTSPEECAEKVEWYLKRDDERRRIAQAGYALVHEKHTYDHRVKDILAELRSAIEHRSTAATPDAQLGPRTN